MTGIEMKDLRLQYGARVIADQLQVTLDKPEIVSIIGPNRSGKSTLLKAWPACSCRQPGRSISMAAI